MSLTTQDLKQLRDVFDSAFDAKFDAKVIPRFKRLETEIATLRNDIGNVRKEIQIMKVDLESLQSVA